MKPLALKAERNNLAAAVAPAKILVRATNWIGDGVMMTPALGLLRRFYPQAEIVVAANPLVAQLFVRHPWCDRVLVFDKSGPQRGLTGLKSFAGQLREAGFDLAILFQKAFEAALLARWAGIPIRAGFTTDARGFLLTHGVRLTPRIKRLHHSRHYLEMLAALGVRGEDTPLKLELAPEEREQVRVRTGCDAWLVLNPGAAYGSAKRWYPERFAAVGNHLSRQLNLPVVIVGGPAEEAIGRDIEQQLAVPAMNLVGRTTVREMMAVIEQSRLLISNDSGPMHIAAAFGAPTVAIFGPTDHTTTYPLSRRSVVVHSGAECAPCLKRQCPIDHHCMLNVTVDDVVSAALDLIGADVNGLS